MSSLSDAKRPIQGPLATLMVTDANPPIIELSKVIVALSKNGEAGDIWLAPLASAGAEHVKAMSMIHCLDAIISEGVPVTCCTAGLDMMISDPLDIIRWCRVTFPTIRFKLAMMLPEASQKQADFWIKRTNDPDPPSGGRVIVISSIAAGDVQARIRAGSDESRIMCPQVWAYIQANKLYR